MSAVPAAIDDLERPLIVVVEDDPHQLTESTAALVDLQCEAVGVSDDALAKRAMDGADVDLVLTDIKLKPVRNDKSGVALARFVKQTYTGVPVLGYSAVFADKDLAAGEKAVFDEVYPKDLSYRELDELLKRCRMLARKHRRRSLWELLLSHTMFDMRGLPAVVDRLPQLDERETAILALVAEGASPRDIASRVGMHEDDLYRFVAWVLEELPPEPEGMTMAEMYRRHGGRAATDDELDEFDRLYATAGEPARGEG